MGHKSMERLLKLIKDEEDTDTDTLVLDTELIVRKSSAIVQ